MSDNGRHRDDSQLVLDRIADEVTERIYGGERPCVDEYTRDHPQLVNEIERLFSAIDAMYAYLKDGQDFSTNQMQ